MVPVARVTGDAGGGCWDVVANAGAEGPIRREGTLRDQSHPHPQGCVSPA